MPNNASQAIFIVECLQVHYILNEIVMGGMVLETNTSEILTRIEEQNKLEKSEVMPTIPPIHAMSLYHYML